MTNLLKQHTKYIHFLMVSFIHLVIIRALSYSCLASIPAQSKPFLASTKRTSEEQQLRRGVGAGQVLALSSRIQLFNTTPSSAPALRAPVPLLTLVVKITEGIPPGRPYY